MKEDVDFCSLPEEGGVQKSCGAQGMPPAQVLVDLEARIALPKKFLNHVDRIKNFEVREDDIWLITFPKCGNSILILFAVLLL